MEDEQHMGKVTRFVALLAVVAVAAVPALADEYELDPLHSAVAFKVGHLGVSYTYGLVPNIEGTFTFDPENPEASQITVQATVGDLTTEHGQRDRHLYDAEILNVEDFPIATFTSTRWEKTGDQTYAVTGDLTLLATTKEVTIEVEHVGSAEGRNGEWRAGFDGLVTVNRSEFGITYGEGAIGEEVTLMIGVEGVRTAEAK